MWVRMEMSPGLSATFMITTRKSSTGHQNQIFCSSHGFIKVNIKLILIYKTLQTLNWLWKDLVLTEPETGKSNWTFQRLQLRHTNCFPPPRYFQATSIVTLYGEISSQNLKYSDFPEIVKCHFAKNVLACREGDKNSIRTNEKSPKLLFVSCLVEMVINNFTQLENFLNATKMSNLATEAISQRCILWQQWLPCQDWGACWGCCRGEGQLARIVTWTSSKDALYS